MSVSLCLVVYFNNTNMSTISMDLERLPLGENELARGELAGGAPSPTLFLPDIGPAVPHVMMSSPSTVDNSEDNSDNSSETSSESSSESEGEWQQNGVRQLLGKRRTSQPVKFSEEFATPRKRRRRTRQNKSPDKPIPTPSDSKGTKRGRCCGQCDSCKKEDCGKCQYCRDKPKFGGPGKKKQRCEKRTCANFQHNPGSRQYMKKMMKSLEASADKVSESA